MTLVMPAPGMPGTVPVLPVVPATSSNSPASLEHEGQRKESAFALVLAQVCSAMLRLQWNVPIADQEMQDLIEEMLPSLDGVSVPKICKLWNKKLPKVEDFGNSLSYKFTIACEQVDFNAAYSVMEDFRGNPAVAVLVRKQQESSGMHLMSVFDTYPSKTQLVGVSSSGLTDAHVYIGSKAFVDGYRLRTEIVSLEKLGRSVRLPEATKLFLWLESQGERKAKAALEAEQRLRLELEESLANERSQSQQLRAKAKEFAAKVKHLKGLVEKEQKLRVEIEELLKAEQSLRAEALDKAKESIAPLKSEQQRRLMLEELLKTEQRLKEESLEKELSQRIQLREAAKTFAHTSQQLQESLEAEQLRRQGAEDLVLEELQLRTAADARAKKEQEKAAEAEKRLEEERQLNRDLNHDMCVAAKENSTTVQVLLDELETEKRLRLVAEENIRMYKLGSLRVHATDEQRPDGMANEQPIGTHVPAISTLSAEEHQQRLARVMDENRWRQQQGKQPGRSGAKLK